MAHRFTRIPRANVHSKWRIRPAPAEVEDRICPSREGLPRPGGAKLAEEVPMLRPYGPSYADNNCHPSYHPYQGIRDMSEAASYSGQEPHKIGQCTTHAHVYTVKRIPIPNLRYSRGMRGSDSIFLLDFVMYYDMHNCLAPET